jgi:hypothetical protein
VRHRNIITEYDPKPTFDRHWDWTACRDDDDDGYCVGYGATREEAIADFLEQERNAA